MPKASPLTTTVCDPGLVALETLKSNIGPDADAGPYAFIDIPPRSVPPLLVNASCCPTLVSITEDPIETTSALASTNSI